MPTARITVELLIRGQVTRKVVASRFREDLRERGIGDGYHAFSLILPPEVHATGGTAHAALRAAGTNVIFWQMNALAFAADEHLKTGLMAMSRRVRIMSGELSQLPRHNQAQALALGFKALALRLRAATASLS